MGAGVGGGNGGMTLGNDGGDHGGGCIMGGKSGEVGGEYRQLTDTINERYG